MSVRRSALYWTKGFLGCFLITLITHQAVNALPPGVGGGGGGGSGSPGVGNSALQNVTPSFGNLSSDRDGCNKTDTRFNDAWPLCGRSQQTNKLTNGPCCSCDISNSGTKGNDQQGNPGGVTTGGSGSSAGGAGCTPCGSKQSGSSASSGVDLRLRADGVSRYFVPNNRVNNSSFSPGYYSQYDSQLEFFPDSAGNVISYFNAEVQSVFRLVDGLDGDTLDGVYKDTKNNHISQLVLLDGSGATTSTVSSAVTARVDHYNGLNETYELIDLDPSTTAATYAGRFTKRKDLDGRELTVTYKTWTSTEISASPIRQWQINTVADSLGNQLTFTYGSTQVGGLWSVSRIDRNDGKYTTYTYASDALTTVANDVGTIASISYGQDSVAQTATVTMNDINMTGGRSMTYHLTNDYMTLTTNGQSAVINQPIGVRRMVVNGASDTEWMLITATDPSSPNRFVYLGGNQAIMQSIYARGQKYDTWTYNPNGGDDGDPIGINRFYGITGTLNSLVIGASSSTTTAQLYTGQIPGSTNEQASQFAYTYNSAGYVTRKTYNADSTYSEFAYNSVGRMTRSRSRTLEVSQYVYDSQGHMTTKKDGLVEQSGSDVATADYSETKYDYYPSTHVNKGLLKTEYNPLYSASTPTIYRTDYEYDSAGRVTKITQSADTSGGTRPVTTRTYDTAGNLATETDPLSRVTSYTYDTFARKIKTTYPDSSTEQTLYGAVGTTTAGKVIKTKDRMGVVTTYAYNTAGALTQTAQAAAIDANILDGMADDTTISNPNIKTIIAYTYLDGSTTLPTQVVINGAKTDYVYDTYNRVTETKQYPRAGVTLSNKKSYANNQLFYDEDPYGRRKYYGYRASDGTLIRTITCAVPEQTFADSTAVWNATRDANPNAKYIIADAIRDNEGHLTQVFDGRGIETRYEYDSKDHVINRRVNYNTTLEARTQTIYDLAGNKTEIRSPRYFDSFDSEGYNKAREQWTYNGRGLVASHTEATGTSIAATEYFTYDLAGHQATRTDFGNNVWTRIEDSCCEKQVASVDPLGHGTITNSDSNQRPVHTIQVSDVSTMTGSFANPTDAKTLGESTTKYDATGRIIYQTAWLVARGSVDPSNPPIAGLGGVSLSDGLTTQYLYDTNLTDGVGLDSNTGVSAPKLGTGGSSTFNVSLSNALTKLADTQANGGAGISFSSSSPGRASIVINAEDEISFTVTDAAGRTVMSGKLNNYRGSGGTALNTLATWSNTLHDSTTSISGYGTVSVTKNIDALGNATKAWTDAAGRTLRFLDQLDNATVMTYDAGGNQLTVRDPNSVGADMVYDNLGRNTQRTDTYGDVIKTEYDRTGSAVKQIDAKNKNTFITYDARGYCKSTTDRISAATIFTYTALGQLASLTDAENQTTSYTYDARGAKLTEQYPDHVSGTPGQSTYGIITFTFDNAGRVLRKQDQAGDTCTYNYDLVSRLTSRNYRTLANSPSGTISDSDTYTFDRAGRMLTATSGRYSNTVTYTCDPIGRKSSEALTIASQTYTVGIGYNARNEIVKYAYPDSSIVDRTYHSTGALNQLKLDSSTISTRSYDNGRRLTSEALGNSITETRTYRNDNMLSTISYSNTNIGDLRYIWDANKNKTSESITGVMSGYGFTSAGTSYDNEDRLTAYARAATSGSAVLSQSWSLTNVGDWSSIATNGTAQTRTHGATHELLTAGSSSVATDVKGNMTSIPITLRESGATTALNLTWDFGNKLMSADIDANGSADVSFQYDALGRRVARTGSSGSYVFVQVDQQTIADYGVGTVASNPTYRYVHANYIDEPVVRKTVGASGTILYYHRNQQYSIYALTDSSGAVSERYAYTAYGQPTFLNASAVGQASSAANNRYSYTAREWDQTVGLHHFRARWMSGLSGRFLSRDPMKYDAGDPNLFRFVAGRPVVYTDPTGMTMGPPWHFPPGMPYNPPPYGGRPPYDPNQSLPRQPWQLGIWLKSKLTASCNSCTHCLGTVPANCDPITCMTESLQFVDALTATLEFNWNPDPYSHFPYGIDNTWPNFPLPSWWPNERYNGYFCYRWAQALNRAAASIGSNCFQSGIESAVDNVTGRFHFWVTLKSKCDGSEVYVDDSFWDGNFGHITRPCGGRYGYIGPTRVDPELGGPFPTPYTPLGAPIPWK